METYTVYFNRFILELPIEAIKDIARQGANDETVQHWIGKIDFSHIEDVQLFRELKEVGAWEVTDLQDRETNESRLLWLAAHQAKEESNIDLEA